MTRGETAESTLVPHGRQCGPRRTNGACRPLTYIALIRNPNLKSLDKCASLSGKCKSECDNWTGRMLRVLVLHFTEPAGQCQWALQAAPGGEAARPGPCVKFEHPRVPPATCSAAPYWDGRRSSPLWSKQGFKMEPESTCSTRMAQAERTGGTAPGLPPPSPA